MVRKVGDYALFLNPLRYDPDAALKRKVMFGDKASIPAQEAASGKTGSGITRDYRNNEVLAAWRYIPTLGWGIVAKIDLQEVLIPVITVSALRGISRDMSLRLCCLAPLMTILSCIVTTQP